MKKIGKAILYGVLLWAIMFILWSIMIFTPWIKDIPTVQYIISYAALIVAVILLSKSFYKSKGKANGFLLGLIFVVVGIILDAVVTVPLFIIPQDMSYTEFFVSIWAGISYALMILTAGIYNLTRK